MKLLKFIIYDDTFRCSYCEYHKDLLPADGSHGKIHGGGIVFINNHDKCLILCGKSHDFGKCSEESILAAKESILDDFLLGIHFEGYQIFFSSADVNSWWCTDMTEIGTIK